MRGALLGRWSLAPPPTGSTQALDSVVRYGVIFWGMAELTIGQLARKAGVGVETIRFYERERLLTKPPRSRSGYRRFGEDAVIRLAFIRRAKNLGFSLKEIRELLALRADPNKDCSAVDRRVQAKIAQIEEKVRELQRMKRALRRLSVACTNGTTVRDCVILDSLSGDGSS